MTSIAERRRLRKAAVAARRAKPTAETKIVRAIRSLADSQERNKVKHSVLHRLYSRGVITWAQFQAGVTYRDAEAGSRDTASPGYDTPASRGGAPRYPDARLQRQAEALAVARDGWRSLNEAGAGIAVDTHAVCVTDQEPRALASAALPSHLKRTDANPDELAAARARIERKIVMNLRLGLDTLVKAFKIKAGKVR